MNGDPTIGRQGSIPPAAVFENPQREIVNVIARSDFTPTDVDLQQLTKSVRSQFLNYAEDDGTPNNLAVALNPPLTSYTNGLVLHVWVKNTNTTDDVRINAGAGSVRIKRMNGADVGEGQLTAGALATLVYDGRGSCFQLSNFGGTVPSGTPQVFNVNIPYTNDAGPVDHVIADFLPPVYNVNPPERGDIIIVKILNTNQGALTIETDGQAPRPMLPNGGGGGQALQGDIHAGDVMVMFYDGNAWWFQPNPEISTSVIYTVGTGQQFTTVAQAFAGLRRKTIGANGHVTLQLVQQTYGPIVLSHPSGDRITIQGSMVPTQSPPAWNSFVISGNGSSQRANDAANNLSMLIGRYGSVIDMRSSPAGSIGIYVDSPGRFQIRNLLIIGNGAGYAAANAQSGIWFSNSYSVNMANVTVANCGSGIATNQGTIYANNCHCSGCGLGFSMGLGLLACGATCGAFSSSTCGFYASGNGIMWLINPVSMGNVAGIIATVSSAVTTGGGMVQNNGLDLNAGAGSSIIIDATSYATSSPAMNSIGNWNSLMLRQG